MCVCVCVCVCKNYGNYSRMEHPERFVNFR